MSKKVLPHEQVQIEQFVIEGLIKGYPRDELLSLLTKDYPHIEQEKIEKIARRGLVALRDQVLVDLDKIIPQHIEIYEKIYKEFHEDLQYVPGKLKALRGKEKLVGLHKEQNFIEIHNEVNVEIEGEAIYDINKLDSKQQKRLSDLMKRIVDK